jgi:DNA-binding transcriptional regulator GbsR (MarR family)
MCLKVEVEDRSLNDFIKSRVFGVDEIFQFQDKRITRDLNTVKNDLKKQKKQLLSSKGFPQLHSLVQETYRKMARDLNWLEHNTQIYENPALKRLEELKYICIQRGINNPVIGEE